MDNPVVVAIGASAVAYFGLKWYDAPNDADCSDTNIIIPIIVFIVVWFIAHLYLSKDNASQRTSITSSNAPLPSMPPIHRDASVFKNMRVRTTAPLPSAFV